MAVRRIVANLLARDPAALSRFYTELLGVDGAMDHGFIVTLDRHGPQALQLSAASEGGSGTPALSVEVDDLSDTLARTRTLGAPIPYGPARKPWGVERFFVTAPAGNLINILSHAAPPPGDAQK